MAIHPISPDPNDVTIARLKRKLARCRTKRDALAQVVASMHGTLWQSMYVRIAELVEANRKREHEWASDRQALELQRDRLEARLWEISEKLAKEDPQSRNIPFP